MSPLLEIHGNSQTSIDGVSSKLATTFLESKKSPPCDILPNEILESIFNEALRMDSFPLPAFDSRDTKRMPVVLGRICSRWRAVAYASPSLWTSIRLTLGHRSKFIPVDYVKTLLQRSGALSLEIDLEVEDPVVLTLYPEGRELLEVLARACVRWGRVHTTMNFEDSRAMVGNVATYGGIPRVQNLNIAKSRSSDPQLALAPSFKLEIEVTEDHKLRQLDVCRHVQLTVKGMPGVLSPSLDALFWQVFWGANADNVLAVLKFFPKITDMSIEAEEGVPGGVGEDGRFVGEQGQRPRIPTLTMPNLQHAHFINNVDLGPLFDRLHAPKLAELYVENWRGQLRPWNSLSRFIIRSNPPLQRLCVKGTNPPDLLSCLQSCPSLVMLCGSWAGLQGLIQDDDMVLGIGNGRVDLVPNLKELHFGYRISPTDHHAAIVMLETLVRLVRSRAAEEDQDHRDHPRVLERLLLYAVIRRSSSEKMKNEDIVERLARDKRISKFVEAGLSVEHTLFCGCP